MNKHESWCICKVCIDKFCKDIDDMEKDLSILLPKVKTKVTKKMLKKHKPK